MAKWRFSGDYVVYSSDTFKLCAINTGVDAANTTNLILKKEYTVMAKAC
jgi:hypothetical protein